MSRAFILCQTRTPEIPKLQIRGVFSQKKKLWEALEKLEPGLGRMLLLDDVTGRVIPASYSGLCNRLTQIGRVTVISPEKERRFLIIESEVNSLRDWDTDDEGHPRINPTKALLENTGNEENTTETSG